MPARTAELVLQTRRGDDRAFSDLVRHYEQAALATALALIPSSEEARDIAQDAFVEAYCKLPQLQEPARFGGWLRTIVRHRALNWQRHRRRAPFTPLEAEEVPAAVAGAAAQTSADQQRHRELWNAVQELPESQREIVLMYYSQRASYRQIASTLDLSVSTVNERLRRARRQLLDRLSLADREEWSMPPTSLEKAVEESIYQIARQEIHQILPLDGTDHIAFFCGVDTNLEICRTDGTEVVLSGSRTAIGHSAAAAQGNLQAVGVQADQVDDFLASGPHPVEIGIGTDLQNDQYHSTTMTSQWWRDLLTQATTSFNPQDTPDNYRTWGSQALYGEMTTREVAIFQRLRHDLGRRLTRLTLGSEKARYILMSQEHYTESIRRVFARANNTFDPMVHGAVGRAELVVALPPGVGITVFRPANLKVADLHSPLNIIHGQEVDIENVQGDIHLLNTHVARATGTRGIYRHSQTTFAGANLPHPFESVREPVRQTHMSNMVGTIQVDLARVNLDAADLHGDIEIRNRFGDTRFNLSTHRPDSRYLLEADSGAVQASVAADRIGTLQLALHTLCGPINARPLQTDAQPSWNNWTTPSLVSFTTRTDQSPEAALCIATRDGAITVSSH
ncbi:MAG: sigma-70 family RNA polymerase sigma factor [Candidatus Latescibacteria bacterium]|nr:sigma-70 family RNA polymerase sigma factor [Candidatus Latescibacterota bacterium]